jgi:hypothetical protein
LPIQITMSVIVDDLGSTASPAFSGVPTTPTPSFGDNSTQVANTAYVNTLMKVVALSSDASANSTTTLAGITGLDVTVGAGTYYFKYIIRYQAAATTTGVKFSVTHTGTVQLSMYQLLMLMQLQQLLQEQLHKTRQQEPLEQ